MKWVYAGFVLIIATYLTKLFLRTIAETPVDVWRVALANGGVADEVLDILSTTDIATALKALLGVQPEDGLAYPEHDVGLFTAKGTVFVLTTDAGLQPSYIEAAFGWKPQSAEGQRAIAASVATEHAFSHHGP